MPSIFSAEQLKRYRWKDKDKEGVFFIPNLYQKQGIVMLDAVHLAQKECDFTLFANGLKRYKEYADAMKLRYVDLGFLPRDDYLEWLASSQLLLHANASEDTIEESLALGTPVLISSLVAKNMGIDGGELIVNDISSAEGISSLISHVLNLGVKDYRGLCESCTKAIEHTAQKKNNKGREETFINLQN